MELQKVVTPALCPMKPWVRGGLNFTQLRVMRPFSFSCWVDSCIWTPILSTRPPGTAASCSTTELSVLMIQTRKLCRPNKENIFPQDAQSHCLSQFCYLECGHFYKTSIKKQKNSGSLKECQTYLFTYQHYIGTASLVIQVPCLRRIGYGLWN